jgi:flavin reductase (DIM6/NTAB) family NADH-FMN oxidoreductase RutF
VTVNSFTSVPLDPPVVLWCLGTESRQRGAFAGAGHFAVNIPGAGQSAVAARFTRHGDRFAGLPPQADPYGLPLLPGVIGVLVCRLARIVPAGDHVILLGTVRSHRSAPGPALLFADGSYRPGPDES